MICTGSHCFQFFSHIFSATKQILLIEHKTTTTWTWNALFSCSSWLWRRSIDWAHLLWTAILLLLLLLQCNKGWDFKIIETRKWNFETLKIDESTVILWIIKVSYNSMALPCQHYSLLVQWSEKTLGRNLNLER